MAFASKYLPAVAVAFALTGTAAADDPPGTKRTGEQPGVKKAGEGDKPGTKKSAEGEGRAKTAAETVTLTGAVSKEDAKRKRDGGEEVTTTSFFLTETKGNKVMLPNPRAGDGGSKAGKFNPADFVGKQVTLTGQAVTAPAREGSSAKRVVKVVTITDLKETSK